MNDPDTSLWKKRWHFNFKELKDALDKSEKECFDLKRMNELIFALGSIAIAFLKIPTFFNKTRHVSESFSQSLLFTSFLESFRNSHHTVFLSGCGMYKNAYHNIRYALEFLVQSYYIDKKYPNDSFPTKVEALTRIENNYKYQGRRLVNKLRLCATLKKEIKKEYSKLSKKVHSTHKQFENTAYNFMDIDYHSVYVDCNEVTNIYKSMITVYDLFFLLIITIFPEIRQSLLENKEFMETIKTHNLTLSLRTLFD